MITDTNCLNRYHEAKIGDQCRGEWVTQQRKRMTMQEISSLLFLASASVVNCFAAAWGSLIDFTRSTASWFFITCIQKGNTEYIKLVYEHTF